jgi:DNA-binding LytR/AlgR family response regulator
MPWIITVWPACGVRSTSTSFQPFVDESSIVYATAARGYSYLQLASERVLVTFSLNELERRLGRYFFRAHRSHLVNLDQVRELIPDFKGSLVLVMNDERRSRVEVSRRKTRELRRLLGM